MSFPRYQKYKPSGVEWLGDVPEHWEVTALKHCVATPITDGPHETPNFPDEGIPFVSAEAVANGAIDFAKIRGFISRDDHERYSTKYRPRVGDIYMVKSGATTGVTAIVETDIEFNIWSPLAAIRCGETVVPRFVLNFLRSRNFQEGVTLNWSFGTQQNIGMGVIENMALAVPPLAEQTLIASFLDRETAKIDGLVGEQRRLIELLKEKRQAVISRAVTKGLNPHAPLKPSGIEWLGDVPKHWEVSRIANLFREVVEAGTDDLPILSVSIHHGVSDKEMEEEEMDRKVTRSDDRSKYKQVAPNDLVYNMMRAWQGGFGTVTVAGMVSPAYVVARPRTTILTAYVEHLLRTPKAIEQMRRHSRGITDFRLRLYWDEFKNIRIPLPVQHETIAICESIIAMDESFDALTAEAERAIELLQERRTALISAAVTGKIDVRGLAETEAA
jgi:type I restriction enzyme S subunit